MNSFALRRYEFSITAAAALLAGCGGSQPPVGVPAGVGAHRVETASSSSFRVLHRFGTSPNDGLRPDASLIDVNGTLYGTTVHGGAYNNEGTVFSISAAGVERVLHSFGSSHDGTQPYASLIDVNGTLYGTTASGGAAGKGTVFSVTTAGVEHVLHSFGSGSDGETPLASLINVNGMLYGTTDWGSTSDGTVFRVSTGGSERVLCDFAGGYSGGEPRAALIAVKGTLYGTTALGGLYGDSYGGDGTLFSVNATHGLVILHDFGKGDDGIAPVASLIDVKGTLYGTTLTGPVNFRGNGTVFSISADGTERVLHSFGSDDGSRPEAGLIDVKGTLYGTTAFGGAYGYGTVFSISTDGAEHVLHSFGRLRDGADGRQPAAGVIYVDGTLYGTTYAGGDHRRSDTGGTAFALRI